MAAESMQELNDLITSLIQSQIEGFDPGSIGSDRRDEYNALHMSMLYSVTKMHKRMAAALTGQVLDEEESDNINRLPAELLVHIFRGAMLRFDRASELVGPNKDIPKYYANLHNIGLVCRRWKGIIDTLPSLWSFVSVYAAQRLSDKVLLSTSKLNIECSLAWGFVDSDLALEDEEIAAFAKSLEPHVHRWDTAVLSMQEHGIEDFRSALEPPNCSLRDVTLETTWEDWATPKPINLLGRVPGRLKRLELKAVPAFWGSATLSGLEYLSLTHLRTDAPSLQELFGIFRCSPFLQILKLEDLEIGIGDTEPLPDIVSLLNLKSIRVEDLPLRATEMLFRRLLLNSECDYFDLNINFDQDPFFTFDFTALAPHVPIFHRHMANCLAAGRCLEFTVGLSGGVFMNAHLRENSGSPGLEMSLDGFLLYVHAARRNLDYLQPLTQLHVAELFLDDPFSLDNAQHTVFRTLATPIIFEGSSESVWLFHTAQSLKLRLSKVDLDALTEMLRKRYAPETTFEGVSLPPPARLVDLDLGKCEPSDFVQEELRNILGQDLRLRWQAPAR